MPRINIVRESAIKRTPRVMQMEGIFDVPPSERSTEQWSVDLALPDQWNVGVIIGPSGSGKTTVARELFGANIVSSFQWSDDKSILDDFPADMSIKEIIELLSSVGFSSPPSWVRPFRVLSNGEQFRVMMARGLAEQSDLLVVDEFTSVVDRTVAQIGSAAIAKTVRRRNQRFIAVSCHYDIVDWLEPDCVYQPHTNTLEIGRSLHRRPPIELEIKRVHHSAWQLFRKHHYLDTELNTAAVCFVAFWKGVPVAFSAWLHFVHAKKTKTKREHRTVTLPDYQGVGIGNALSAYIASAYAALGFGAISTTSNPAMIHVRNRSSEWKITRRPSLTSTGKDKRSTGLSAKRADNRLSCGFEYVGQKLELRQAELLLKVTHG